MTPLITIAATWTAAATGGALLIGSRIRHRDHNSTSMRDHEVDACELVRATRPNQGFTIIEMEKGYRVIVNWNDHTAARIIKGKRTDLDWPLALNTL